MEDSDGDGRSNGAELGNPDCDNLWQPGRSVMLHRATGHPGEYPIVAGLFGPPVHVISLSVNG